MRSCMSWSEMSTSESEWIYLEIDSPWSTAWSVSLLYDSGRMLPEAFAMQLSRDTMIPSISEGLWLLEGVWIQLRWLGITYCNSRHCFVHLRCWWSLLDCLLWVREILRHCEDNAYVSYLRYSGIVRTMPTYLIWDTPVLWGQCLRIFLGLWIFDLESCIMIFMLVTCCWLLVMTVSELL